MTDEIEQLREATRVARETLKDLRGLLKEVEQYHKAMSTFLGKEIMDRSDEVLVPYLTQRKGQIDGLIEQAANHVIKVFVRLGQNMLHELARPGHPVRDQVYRHLINEAARELTAAKLGSSDG